MKKILSILAIASMFFTLGTSPAIANDESIEVVPTMATESTAVNRAWVGTFQIIWNELINEVLQKPVKFVKYNSELVTDLNKQKFKKEYLSEDSYYTTYGVVSPDLREKIANAIKEKFNETSDILNMFDWTYNPNSIFFYAMLKKDFEFLSAFDELTDAPFGYSFTPVKYFGINNASSPELYKNVKVLYYNSENDYAVKLLTKSSDSVILYRTDDEDKTFEQYYADFNNRKYRSADHRKFAKHDTLKVPNINLYKMASFKELEGHRIKGRNITIDKTLETIEFKMDNKGVQLKSEAGMIATMSLMPQQGRNFSFDDKFVLFLIEKGQRLPYFALKVGDVETINQTGRE